ncbi:PqqD family peptide modification chaperone [Runella sp. CRIBMP]|uniref:PqqD family protein n=1 Tax=Runella sp. CRIBMP TaxID=2683261 RepID=UPI001411F4BD|nr:PqqD family protein [Runella sp. CRIBMP]NBB22957.1 PqqD family peptide modification chaperone [Runella sp. CRIBMP]
MALFIRNNETISGQLNDDLVMVDIEKGSYFSLNSVATRIWELLENPLSSESLYEVLMAEYEVSPEQCRTEVNEYLEKMKELGLIQVVA